MAFPGRFIFPTLALLLFVYACATVPYTERKQIMMLSEGEEETVGQTLFTQVKQESKISPSPEYNALVNEVGRRIASVADKPDYQWEFVVIEDKSQNAFALPGGKVAFYTGIMPVCADENGVATVMGHEVAHVLARHGAERMSQQQALAVGKAALFAAIDGGNPATVGAIQQAYGIGAQVGVLLPYSRKHESEADRIGLILMAKAGYNPEASVEFWKRMAEAGGKGSGIELLSTHPSDERRIKDLQAALPEAMKYYQTAIAQNPGLQRPPVVIR